MYISPKLYQHIWLPATFLLLGLAPYNIYLMVVDPTDNFMIYPDLIFLVPIIGSLTSRVTLLMMEGEYFMDAMYYVLHNVFLALAALGLVAYAVNSFFYHLSVWIAVQFFCDALMCVVERGIGFQVFMMDRMIIQCLQFLVAEDSISFTTEEASYLRRPPLWSRLISVFRRQPTGPIVLPPDDDTPLEMDPGAGSASRHSGDSPWIAPAELTETLTDWSRLSTAWHTYKALWITADSRDTRNGVSREAIQLFSSADFGNGPSNVALIDVSDTHSVFWPFIYGFTTTSAEYRKEIRLDPPSILAQHIRFGDALFHIHRTKEAPDDSVQNFLIRPVNQIYERLAENSRSDAENAESLEMTRTILVVRGIRNTDQAEEIYHIVDILQRRLKNRCKGLSIVMISEPQLFRHVVENKRAVLNCVSMYVSDSGSILYSGNIPSYPILHENIFLLVVDSLHRIGGSQAARIWPKVKEISLHAFDDEDESTSVVTIFARLHKASKDRRRILECLPEMSARTRAEIPEKIRQDNVRIVGVLQELFELNYKRDISVVPVEHATAVLNLTHFILDTRLSNKNSVIVDYPVFLRRAHRLLNLLAGHLGILPEELTVSNVVLLSDYPIAHGGFANIYHGKYTNSEGREQEVALKVLKIFEEQSEERRRILHASFFKEALAWYYLKHKNIVSFLGVESTIFPSPFRAMVSTWMPQGSVLKYMTQHTPASLYAIELLSDVIQGLEYLHSVNVVHGDLCGRNILIDRKGNAQLADFGLTTFIESDTTRKTSTRSGSTRWMAPELIVPPSGVQFKRTSASDIWAFGCVCCEIWSEGVEPFSHFPQETLIIIMFSDDFGNALQRKPYQARPRDKGGVLMPERIWEFVQLCWEEKASERPTASVIADMLSGYGATPDIDENVDTAIPSGSGTGHDSRSPSPSPSTDYFAAESSTAPPKVNKGKQVRFEDDYAVVQFGPLDLDTGPEEAFFTVFEALMEVVPRGALSEPRLIHEYNSDHLHLHFRSPVEANNFTMTWTVHRFEPYLECTATVVDL